MSTLLAKNAEVLVTMDSQRREVKNAGLYAENGFIKQVGPNEELPGTADTVIDLTGQIVLPGFINTHHHLNQTLTRNLFAAQNNNLFPWLQAQYRIWARTTEEASRASTLIGLAELALSGCTTVFDHTYVFKSGNNLEVILSKIKPGMDDAYREWAVRIQAAQAKYAGYRGMYLQPPTENDGLWTTIIRYDTAEHLEAWMKAPERGELLAESKAFIDHEQLMRLATSFPGWVPINPVTGKGPPNWKTL
jgi:cytosine/adenosine deaminase-related metal-dependent hydrolase